MLRRQKKEPSEIDIAIKMTEKMTADEMTDYILSWFIEDFGLLKRLINEEKKMLDEAKGKPGIQPLLKKSKRPLR